MESLFEQLGGPYTRQGDYCLPDICLPPEEERPIGIYGQRRRVYLKKHHRDDSVKTGPGTEGDAG